MSTDFRDWSPEIQERCVDSIRAILDRYKIPYKYSNVFRPRHQILLLPDAGHTDALLAVYSTMAVEIEMLKSELYRLRGMTKNEWKSEEEVTEGLLHSTERN